MNTYEQRQEAKRERLEAAADKARRKSEARLRAAQSIADAIPMGQPILVGHHSERHHRRDLDRIDRNMRAGIAAERKAEHLEQRAENVGTGGIASDDPEAVVKLRGELATIRAGIEHMKAQNAAFRKGGAEALDPAGAKAWERLQRIAPYEKQPFPSYALTNAGANARRIEKRIAALTKATAAPPLQIAGPDFTLAEDRDEGRLVLTISGGARLSPERYAMTRSSAFLWARSRGAFVRKITPNAIGAARRLAAALTASASAE